MQHPSTFIRDVVDRKSTMVGDNNNCVQSRFKVQGTSTVCTGMDWWIVKLELPKFKILARYHRNTPSGHRAKFYYLLYSTVRVPGRFTSEKIP